MLGVLDESHLELMPGQLHDTLDFCGVQPGHSGAGKGGKGEGGAGHNDTV